MRFTSICTAVALTACALAEDAYLWTIDHGTVKHANTQASSISPETARSIIARRRGMTDDSHLTNVDASLLREIKQYGGYQVPLYGITSDPKPAKVLIRISGYTGTVSQFPSLPDLWIEDATKDLASDFKATKDVQGRCEYDFKIAMKSGVDLVYSYDPDQGSACMSMQEVQIQPTVLVLFSTVPTAEDASNKLNGLLRTLNHLSVTGNVESTLLILPPTAKLLDSKPIRHANAQEELLELPEDILATGTKSASETRPVNTSQPLPSIVPECYDSQESCENTTNSCSGHGSCYKAHGGCYKCKCGATVARENPDGTKKTIQWGGYACQKKDISTEFFLFASIAVVLSALIAGSIGAMYTMGSQELPSVIGAGVSGPKQK